MSASLHIGDGFARIGGVTLPARATARGLELGSDAVLHPIPFGLRSRLVAWGGDDLPELLLAEMLSGEADGRAEGIDPLALQTLALQLAGADSGAPGFAASAALVARLLGWPLADINAAEALEIDRLAASLAPSMEEAEDAGWTTVLFSGAESASGEDESLESMCKRLTANLRRRASEGISRAEAAVLSAASRAASVPLTAQSEETPAVATRSDPPPDPWRQSDPPPDPWWALAASTSQPPGFRTAPVPVSAPASRFAQPVSARGPDAAVWAQPEIDGNPALAYRTGPETASVQQGQPQAAADPEPAPAAEQTVPLPPAGIAHAAGGAGFPAAVERHGQREPFIRPNSPVSRQPLSAFARPSTPTRSDLFWQAVAPEAPAAHQPASFETQHTARPQPLPMTQAAAEPALDLDGIADALNAIADLRGVAR